jgi:multidrug efflux pump subunit AcrB
MKDIAFAVIAITISLIAVFTPLAFQNSAMARLRIEFAAAVAGSVAVSIADLSHTLQILFGGLDLSRINSARSVRSGW